MSVERNGELACVDGRSPRVPASTGVREKQRSGESFCRAPVGAGRTLRTTEIHERGPHPSMG